MGRDEKSVRDNFDPLARRNSKIKLRSRAVEDLPEHASEFVQQQEIPGFG